VLLICATVLCLELTGVFWAWLHLLGRVLRLGFKDEYLWAQQILGMGGLAGALFGSVMWLKWLRALMPGGNLWPTGSVYQPPRGVVSFGILFVCLAVFGCAAYSHGQRLATRDGFAVLGATFLQCLLLHLFLGYQDVAPAPMAPKKKRVPTPEPPEIGFKKF